MILCIYIEIYTLYTCICTYTVDMYINMHCTYKFIYVCWVGRHHGGPYYPCLHGDCTGKAKQQLAVQGNLEGWNSSNTRIQKKLLHTCWNKTNILIQNTVKWNIYIIYLRIILYRIMEMPTDKDFHHLSSIHWDPCCIPQASDLWMSGGTQCQLPPPGISWGRDGIGHTLKFLRNIEGITWAASHTRVQSWPMTVHGLSRYKKHVRLAKLLLEVAPQGITS